MLKVLFKCQTWSGQFEPKVCCFITLGFHPSLRLGVIWTYCLNFTGLQLVKVA